MDDYEACWCFSQIKGSMDEDMVTDADLISTVEFNQDGRLLATGDKGGRVVIFRRENIEFPPSNNGEDEEPELSNSPYPPNNLLNPDTNATAPHNTPSSSQYGNPSNRNRFNYDANKPPFIATEYNFYSTFQSHEPEFDYLKSLEIEEKINRIKWLQPRYPSYFLLTTNDKTIKLWKIMERDKKFEGFNVKDETGYITKTSRHINNLVVPKITQTELMVEATLKRIYANAHTYHINSISINSDQETFLSADDLRINLWNLSCDNISFNIVDLKPSNMEDLSEVITAAEFHPSECNLFVYATSKGIIRLCDMRDRALCDKHAKLFEDLGPPETPNSIGSNTASKSFFSEIIASVSDVRFACAQPSPQKTPSNSSSYTSSNGPSGSPSNPAINNALSSSSVPDFKFATRDYLTVKIWDTRYETRAWHTFNVLDQLRFKLCALYENDAIFDKFEVCWSGNNDSLLTGSYNNVFRIFDLNTLTEQTFQAGVPDTAALKISSHSPKFSYPAPNKSPFTSAIDGLTRRPKSVPSTSSRVNYIYYKPLRPVQIVAGYTPPVQNNETTGSAKSNKGFSGDPYSSRYDLSRQDSIDIPITEEGQNSLHTQSPDTSNVRNPSGTLTDSSSDEEAAGDSSDNSQDGENPVADDATESSGGLFATLRRNRKNKRAKHNNHHGFKSAAHGSASSSANSGFGSSSTAKPITSNSNIVNTVDLRRPKSRTIGVDSFDFSKKILHASWHPQDPVLAIATNNNLFVFQKI